MANLIKLETTTGQGRAATASYTTAAFLVTVPNPTAQAEAHASVRNTGTAGFWYVVFNKALVGAPSATNYSKKLGPGESWTERNMPYGDIWLFCDGSANGTLDWYVGWGLN